MDVDFDIIFKIGSLAGLFTFIWFVLKDSYKYFRKPKLKITFEKNRDLKLYHFRNTNPIRICKFANLHIKNDGADTAKRCVAILKILKNPETATNIENEYALHWAGVPYTNQTTGAEPVDIGPELRRLDVVFTDSSQIINGSWISMPIALSGDLRQNQAYLLPGEYEVEIRVKCENGKGDVKKFKIFSPEEWRGLDFDILN